MATVKELIEHLKTLPEDAKVRVVVGERYHGGVSCSYEDLSIDRHVFYVDAHNFVDIGELR
jgi:hypothetical protein